MAATYDSQRLRQLRQMDQRLTAEHRALARNVAALVQLSAVNRAGQDATVPNTARARADLKSAIWQRVVKPYYIGGSDDAFRDEQPASPYARLLYDGVSGAVRIQVERQAKLLSQQVKDRNVLAWLTGQRPRIITEQRGIYEPFHRWVDPNGYRLSDRVWTAAIDVRTRIDRLLDYEIGRGTSATRIASLLEDYLTPGAALIHTNTPYGKEGSFAARRLARTEITAASGRATVNASIANPFVQGIRWALSASHRPEKADQCDYNAHGGINGDGVYTPDSVPRYPNHPHCMCALVPVPAGDTAALVEQLRTEIRQNSRRARALQGLLNVEFLHQAIMTGLISDLLEQIESLFQQATAIAPANAVN
jgi:hypothetical protein